MHSVIEYVAKVDHPLGNDLPNAVDALCFAMFATARAGMLSAPASFREFLSQRQQQGLFNDFNPELHRSFLHHLALCPRFEDVLIEHHVDTFKDNPPLQFAAYTLLHGKQFATIAFRGTDSTFVGWRETFQFAIDCPILAHHLATNYLEAAALRHPERKLIVVGHSKGGNEALFAAVSACAEIQERITALHCFDSPGFLPGVIEDEALKRIAPRVNKYVAYDSAVGFLLEDGLDYLPVACRGKGFEQHDLFSWHVEKGDFVYLDEASDTALRLASTANEWLESLSVKDRAVVVDAVFDAIYASGAASALDLVVESPRQIMPLLIAAARGSSRETRRVIGRAARDILRIAATHGVR